MNNLYDLYSQPEELDLYAELGSLITQYKSLVWRNAQGQLHRDGDLPAVIRADGTKIWYKDGLRHRDGDKPAEIWADGALEWLQHGELHRVGGPAVIRASDGTERWYKEGTYIPTDKVPPEEMAAWQEKKTLRGAR